MKTTISLQSAIGIGGCDPGLQRAADFIVGLGYSADTEFEFDFFISLCKENNARFLESFLLENKAQLLEYTNTEFRCYVARNNEYNTLEEARIAINNYKQERREYHRSLTTVGFTQTINGNSVWSTIDIDNFEITNTDTEHCFYVFNHKSGSHEQASSKTEAIQLIDQLINQCIESEAATFYIRRKLVYLEDNTTTKLELVE